MCKWIQNKSKNLAGSSKFRSQKASKNTGEVVVQETLSMLPACALDVRPGHRALDLCSAPGSKTCQLLDALQGESASALVANDLLLERAERVKNRAKFQRCRELMVTNWEAQAQVGFLERFWMT